MSGLALLALLVASPLTSTAQTYNYVPTTGTVNWSTTGGTVWTPSGSYPNGAGIIVNRATTGTSTLTQDVSGGVTVGTIQLGGANASAWTITPTNAITFNNSGSGAALTLNSSSNAGRIVFGTGTVTLADNFTITNSSGTSTNTAGSIVVNSVVGGSGNLTINNAISNTLNSGHVALNGANTFTGNVVISKGITAIGNSTALGNSSNAVTLGSSGGGDTTLVAATIAGSTLAVANNITVASGSGGTLVLGLKSNGTSAVNTSVTYSGQITLNGNVTLDSSVVGVSTGTANTIVTGAIGGAGALTVTTATNNSTGGAATPTVQLRGTNTFSGDTRIASGILRLGATSGSTTLALQNSTLNLATADTGTLSFGVSATDNITAATFGGLSGSRNLTLANILTSPTGVALSLGNNNASTTFSGIMSGAGSLAKIGTGTFTVSGANTFTGATTLSAGKFEIGVASVGSVGAITSSALGRGSLALNGGTLSSDSTTARSVLNTINFGGNVTLGDATNTGKLTFGAAVDLGGATRVLTTASAAQFDGILSNGGLTKAGSGVLTLTAANTYTGVTAINAGTLALSGSGAFASSPTIVNNSTLDVSALANFSISTSQTLQGTGTVVGNTTIAGTFSPGNSPGVMTFTGDLTLAGISNFEINGATRGSQYDGVDVGGLLTYGGDLAINFSAPASAGLTYYLFSFGSAPGGNFNTVSISGVYGSSLINNAGVWSGSDGDYNFAFNQATGDLTVMSAAAIPEPSTYAALAGLGVLAFAIVRRHRESSS